MKRTIPAVLAAVAVLATPALAEAGTKDPKTTSPGYVVKTKPIATASKAKKAKTKRYLGRRWSSTPTYSNERLRDIVGPVDPFGRLPGAPYQKG